MFLRHTGGRLAAAYLIITVVLVMIPKPDIPETASGAFILRRTDQFIQWHGGNLSRQVFSV